MLVSNKKQIALGTLMYIQDYDETFPIGAYSYVCNANLTLFFNRTTASYGTFPGKPSTLASVQAPAQVVLSAHGTGIINGVGGDDWLSGCTGEEDGYPLQSPVLGASWAYCAARYQHSGGSVYSATDSHVKWFRGPSTSWNARSTSGVAWRKSLAPDASLWFRED